MLFAKFVYYLVQSIPVTLEVVFSGGSRPSDKGGGGEGGLGGGHPDPEIRGRTRSPKKFFSVHRASGGGGAVGRALPLDPPLVLSFFRVFYPVLCSQNFLS